MSATNTTNISSVKAAEEDEIDVPNLHGGRYGFWMTDGTIVLAAHSIQHGCKILFKVHQSILARHSTVFRDMFDLPKSENPAELHSQDTYEGVPLIDVQDSAEDWTDLLRLLYGDLSGLSFVTYDPDLESSLFGVMRLVKKYDLEQLRSVLTSRVEAQWPQTHVEWSLYKETIKRLSAHPHLSRTRFLEPAAAIRLATDHNIPRILPAAFYALSCINIEDEWTTRIDKIKLTDKPVLSAARWHVLTAFDYHRLLCGKKELDKISREYFKRLSCGISCTATDCRMPWRASSAVVASTIFAYLEKQDILDVLGMHVRDDCWKTSCTFCRSRTIKLAVDTRDAIWQRLPKFFGLGDIPGWTLPLPVNMTSSPNPTTHTPFHHQITNLVSLPPLPPGPLTLGMQSTSAQSNASP